MGRLGALRRRFTGGRVSAPKRSLAALASLSLIAGLLTTGAVVAVGDAPRAEAAPSPTQQWVTSVSGVTGSGVGAARTLTFQSGVAATETTTAVTGTCVPFGTGAAMSGVSQFLEPDPPAEVRAANNNCAGPTSGSNSRTSSVEFSKPVIAPVIHVANLDASRLGVTGADVSLTELAKNNAMEVQGTTLNATLQQALNPGCALNDGSNPNGACGSFRLTSSTPVTTFSLANDTLGSPVFGSGENDSWNYTLSYPTAPLTKEFSPASIRVGETSQLTFTIANPAAPTQPTLSPMGFTDTLPAGVTIADDTVTASEGCAAATVEAIPGSAEFTASGVSVDPGARCDITVNVTSDTAGSYRNSTDNLTTTVANLVPNADTTLTVTAAPVSPTPFACTPGQPGILSQNAPADFFTVDLVTGASTEVRSDAYPFNLNATGFNPSDNFIYGNGANPAGVQIVRVDSDWNVEELGLPTNWTTYPGIPSTWTGGAHIGEFDADGHYWMSNGGPWAEIDLSDPASPTYMEVIAAGTLAMPTGWTSGHDWTYNVEDGNLYTLGMNVPATAPRQFALLRFDTASHAMSVVGTPFGTLQHPNGQYAAAFGAVYSDPDGQLYGSDNTTGGIWRVDMASGTADFFASGPASSLNDGARCFNSPLPIDFGDAPDSYGTSLATDGPRHSIPGYDGTAMTAPVMLGATIDSETDGQPSAAANGDGADEDGVTFNPALGYPSPTLRTGLDPRSQQPLQNTLEVEASADGFVSVWVDWNQDGDFLDDGERVAHAQAVTAGSNEVTFSQATNPDNISSYVRVRYSTDAASIATPTGSSPDGEVEDYRVLMERHLQPDACTTDGSTYWAFTFGDPVDLTGTGGPGSSARYEGVTVVEGTAVDMVAEVVAGQMQVAGSGSLPPNGFGSGGSVAGFGDDDARWQIRSDATIRYSFYEAGTTNPIAISGAFTANDMDRSADGTIVERATFSAADLAGYGVSELSRVAISESGDEVAFEGTQPASGDPASRFQIVLNDIASFEARWQGGNGSGFGFDGDGDMGIQPPACSDFGDAPNSYGTDLASNGPRHTIVPGLLIGSEIDVDTDGQPTPEADGDDTNRIDDEDAFDEPVILNPGVTSASFTVPVTNTTGAAATLYGWIDANADGRFQASEFASVAVPADATSVELAFAGMPATVVGSQSALRLRLTTDELVDDPATAVDERALGAASNGEVEDHRFEVPAAAVTCVSDTSLFNTASDWSGGSLPAGSRDVGWQVGVGDGAGYESVTSYEPAYVIPPAAATWARSPYGNADWISYNANGVHAERIDLYFRYDFTISELVQLDGFTLPMDFYADNSIPEVWVNGVAQSQFEESLPQSPGNAYWHNGFGVGQQASTRLSTGFQHGENSVIVRVASDPGGVGFLAQILPEPVCADYGDAPDSYGTTAASNGPRHGLVPGLTLGTEIDPDADGQPTAAADGDDTNGVNDEDAFDGPVILNPGVTSASLTVPVTNTTGSAATLYGWIDANADGRFQASEFASVVVPDGATSVELAFAGLPSTVDGSQPVLRLRLTSDVLVDDPATTDVDERALGAASNGEVEDHLVTVLERLVVRKSSDATADTRPGDTVTYTVTAENTGPGDYTAENPAVVFDDLSGVLDDARYNGDAEADADGALDFESPLLSWVGELGANETVTITYSVTLGSNGDGTVRNVAFAPGCDPADEECDTTTPACDPPQNGVDPTTGLPCAETELLLPSLRHTKVADTTELPADGGVVTYTVTVENTGPGAFTDAAPGTMTDDLTHVLDDAGYNGDASADRGTASFDEEAGTLSWSGALAAGEVATITYSVTYDDATGDNVLLNLACVPADLADNPADACRSVQIPGSALQDRKSVEPADGSSVVAGQEVTYTLYFENTGEADATVDTFDDLSDVLDDATLTGQPTTSDEALSAVVNGSQIDVTGTVAPGETLTVSYTVTVLPFDEQGDHVLGNVLGGDEGCATFDPTCRTENPVRHVSVEKSSDAVEGVNTGDVVTYTVTIENDGEGDYTDAQPAVVRDDLSGVLDDATYGDDAEASAGDVSFEAPQLTWRGALAAGESVTVTYSVVVTNAGDHELENVAGAVCADPEVCDPPVTVVTPLPHIVPSKSATPESGTGLQAGDEVTYTLSWTNDGGAAGAIDSTDDLSDVLDDADVTAEPVASTEAVTAVRDGDEIRITGTIGAGETVTVSYTVTVKADGERGDNIAENVLTPDVPPYACAEDVADCDPFEPPTTRHPIGELEDWKTADPASGTSVVAGQEVTYTLHFENTGEADVTVDTFDDLSGVLDDAELTTEPTTSDEALSAVVDGSRIDVDGTVAPGETLTVSYTVTVLPFGEQGDHVLGNVLGGDEGCAADDATCRTENPVRHVSVEKSSDAVEGVNTGDVVTYTVTIENDGEGDYTEAEPAIVRDDLTAVLDDATYRGDASATAGEVSFEESALTWTGALAAGETVTVTYSVTVTNAGDHELENVAGPVCSDPEVCDPPVTVVTPLPHIVPSKSATPDSGTGLQAGDEVTYTLSWTNHGGAAGAIDSTDDLSDVLDDADVTAEPVSSDEAVTAVRDGDAIRITGTLGAGETVTVSYTVTVKADGERGDNIAENVLTPDVPPHACAEGAADCDPFEPPTTQHPIGQLAAWKTVDPASGSTVQAGQELTYTLHFENTGEADVDVLRDDVLTGVLDDADVTAEPVSSDDALAASAIEDGRFTVTGTLAAGEQATVSYTVTVLEDGERGDDRLGNFLVPSGEEPTSGECAPADPERPDCTVNLVSAVVASKSADPASGTEVSQGQEVTYTLTFENVSDAGAADAAIDYTDHLVGVLDDAALSEGPVSSDAGVTAVHDGDTIRITGAVAAGATVTVTYTVTVHDYDEQGDHLLGNVLAVTGEEPACAPDSPLCTEHELVPPPALPVTGADLAWMAALGGLLLLLAGAGAIMVHRRRELAEAA